MAQYFNFHSKKELYIRVIGIVLLGIACVLVFKGFHSFYDFSVNSLISIFECAVFWNGTILTVDLVSRIFPPDKKIVRTVIALFLFIATFVLLVVLCSTYISSAYRHKPVNWNIFLLDFIISTLITYFISTFYTAVFLFNGWQENVIKAEQLEKANLEARFETLKTQVNPHFLFNSLNTLLTFIEDNPKATTYVENLSELLRYILQTRNKEAVLLRDELTIVRKYVYIQEKRFDDKLRVTFDVPESVYHYAIPPVTLQMLVENAIKHNVISREHKLHIRIFIETGRFLVIENPINLRKDKELCTGIGLNNIRNRYLLLSGQNIEVSNKNNIFRVKIPLLKISL